MKIFGIGLSRTGTTSLAEALAILGYNSAHFILPSEIFRYDAVTDVTVSVRYKELDALHPGSKFILTLRNIDSWAASYKAHVARVNLDLFSLEWLQEIAFYRTRLYGCVKYNDAKCRRGFIRHLADVRRYFRHRSNDLLEMDVSNMDSWTPLCAFLKRPVPNAPFPRLNQAILPQAYVDHITWGKLARRKQACLSYLRRNIPHNVY